MKIYKIKLAAPIKYIIYMSMLNKNINLNNKINFNKKIEELRKEIISKYSFDPEEIKDKNIININNIEKHSIREFLINIGNKLGREKGFVQILKNKTKLYEFLNIKNYQSKEIYINNIKNKEFLTYLSNNLFVFAKKNLNILENQDNIWVYLSLKNLKNNELNLITDLRFKDEMFSFLSTNNNKSLINLVPIKEINKNFYYNSTEININKNYSTFLKLYKKISDLDEFITILEKNGLIETPEILSTILSFNEYIKKYKKEDLNQNLNNEITKEITNKVDYLVLFNDKDNKSLTNKNINKIKEKSKNKNIVAAIGPKRTGKDFYIENSIINEEKSKINIEKKIKL